MAIINSIYRPFTNKTGLTLIEVLIALTILTIGLLGVAMMQVMSITGNTFSREMVVGTGLAQDMLEKLSTFEYTATNEDTALAGSASPGTNHPTANDVPGLAPAPDTDGNATTTESCNSTTNLVDERGLQVGPLVYIRTWNVMDDDIAANTNMKTITVTVCWKERGTTDRLVAITSVKVRE